MQRLSTRILSFLMAIIMMLSLTTSVFATAPTDPAESNNQTEVSDPTGDESAPSEETPVEPAAETNPLPDDTDKPSPQPEVPSETPVEAPTETPTETQNTQNTQDTQDTQNTPAASQPDPVPVTEGEITAPVQELPRLTALYEGHRVRYYDSAKQPLPEHASLHMDQIDEEDIPFYLQRAAHALGLESCGMYLYFIADPILEDASTAEVLHYNANPDDPNDRMTVEVTLIDDADMTDEEKAQRLNYLHEIHIEDLQVILLGSTWEEDTLAPFTYDEETGVIRFTVETVGGFILLIPDWDSAVYPEEDEVVVDGTEIPTNPEVAEPQNPETGTENPSDQTGDIGTQQMPAEPGAENPSGTTGNENPVPGADVPTSPDEPVAPAEQTVTASGADYSVSLTYSADANIPEGAVFELSELPGSGIVHENLKDSVANTLNTSTEDIVSVTFVDVDVKKDGESVTPNSDVSVSIEVDDSAADSDTVTQVVALGEKNEILNPDEDSAAYKNVTDSLSSTYAIVRITKQATLKTDDDQNYLITVTYDRDDPSIPVDVELVVKELKEGDPGYDEYVAASAALTGADRENLAFARAFDIALVDPATKLECQPTKEVSVSVQLLEEEVNENTQIDVVHFGEPDSPEKVDCALNEENNAIEFAAPGFSVYLIMGYTVDFHWGDYTYSIAGESEITLSALFEKLGVTEITLADVTDLSFSNPEYIAIERLDSDWMLRSLAPFHTDEKLTLTLINGKTVEIKVTDVDYNVYNNANAVIGSWTLDSERVLTVTGTGAMKDYNDSPWVGGTPWFEYIVKDSTHSDPPVTKIVIHDGITRIGTNSFTRTYNLNEIDASNCTSLTTIGGSAFKQQSSSSASNNTGNPKIINFSGCEKLSTIETDAFRDCKGIKELDISGTKLSASSITTAGAGFGASTTSLTILRANGCTTNFAMLDLSGRTNLQTVELSGCTNLTGMNLPDSVTTLDLSGCIGLPSLTVPSSVTTLNVSGCTGLTTLDVSACNGLTSLDVSGCTGLTTLDASACTGLTSLDVSGCTSLTSLTVPSGVTTLNVSNTGLTSLDLSGCTALTTLNVSGCTGLTSLTVPSGVTTLNVSGCTGPISLDLSACRGLTSLDASGCEGLTVLDLSAYTSLTVINLSNNASLTALKLPESVNTLDVNGCSNDLVIYFDGEAKDLPEGLIPDGAKLVSWGDYTYSIKKNRTATLDEIFAACGITAITVSGVQSIATDSSVLEVTDLTVKCLDASDDTQTLTVTLKNGLSGAITVHCSSLEESDNLNEFIDDSTTFSYVNETTQHPISEAAIVNTNDGLSLTLSFSEIPEEEEGERQMAMLTPMTYTFPAELQVTAVPESVIINLGGGETVSANVTQHRDTETDALILTITVIYDEEKQAMIESSTTANFTIPVTIQVSTVPAEYELGCSTNSIQLLLADTRHNAGVTLISEEYDAENGTIQYTAAVTAENDLDYGGKEYPVTITDLTIGDSPILHFVSGSYIYTHKEDFVLPEGAPATQVNGENVEPGTATAFIGFPLTVAHMYDGDTITLTYTASPLHGTYDKDNQQTVVQNTVTIDNSGNPTNDPEDDTASVTNTVPYTPLTREFLALDGSWAYWCVTVNPNGYTLNEGSPLTLADTFDDKNPMDAAQSIDYSSIVIEGADGVSYDYSGSTGTFVIPDNTAVTITFRTRITAQPGEAKTFRGTARLQDGEEKTIASATAGAIDSAVVIYPSPSDVDGSGNYMVKLFVYAENTMQTGIGGAQFILLDANQRPLEYKLGENKGQPVTFTTGSDGYVNIELHEEPGDVSIEKNTGYYLEMMQAVPGYQKDNILYSFMITDDPSYNTGGFYKYYNGDTMKVRLTAAKPGLTVSIRFTGSYTLRQDEQNNVQAILKRLNENQEWETLESHPYTESRSGSISFTTPLEQGELYHIDEENQRPWDLPDYIILETTYYLDGGKHDSQDYPDDPQVFYVEQSNDTVNIVIDNRYEDPQLTIVKMDKQTGEVLPGAVFSVYEIVNGTESGGVVTTYTTDDAGELVIRGGEHFVSETLYGIKETTAPVIELNEPTSGEDPVQVQYLLPLKDEWHYFYFCNDEEQEQSILDNLPEGETAVNLTKSGDRVTVDNQKEMINVPVMKIWQGNVWPNNTEVVVGLYRALVDAEGTVIVPPEPVRDGDGNPRTVNLTKEVPYNNTAFNGLPSRDTSSSGVTCNVKYSIVEESINGGNPLDAGYVQEYGISSAGVYIVRNKPATTLAVTKEWYDLSGNPVTDPGLLAAQSSVTFDVYRSTEKIPDDIRADGITNAEMMAFVSSLVKVKEDVSFGASDDWETSVRDLDRWDSVGAPYYYYILETVPSFGNELYFVDEEDGTITIQNKIAPDPVDLTVTKAELVDDPRQESLNRDFEFTLKLKVDDTHPVRSWTVCGDRGLITDKNGEATFKLKPNNEDGNRPEASITLSLPSGVTASVTEAFNPEYTVVPTASVPGTMTDEGRTFSYNTSSETDPVTLTYTNTLHVICKVVPVNEEEKPFESLASALKYIRDNQTSFTSPWTIYMLEDYTIPTTDVIRVNEDESLTLTTAPIGDAGGQFPFKPPADDPDRSFAVITRGGAGGSILKNEGILTLENICLDGAKDSFTAAGDGGLVYSTGTLNLNDKTTLRNSAANGKGGAVYAEGTVNIASGVAITGSSASSASALYLSGTLNMTGGSITDNTGAADGAVVASDVSDSINLSGDPQIFGNTNQRDKAANLFIGADSNNVLNVVEPGLDDHTDRKIGITAQRGHMQIGQQFGLAAVGVTDNLSRFINDVYGYRGKLKDGTNTNIVWDGLTITIDKIVDEVGANPDDRFTIILSSQDITQSTYHIEGSIDYTVSPKRVNKPGTITLNGVKAGDEISISPLPVSEYTIAEDASNYNPTYKAAETEGGKSIEIVNGKFTADNNSTVTVTNTRRLAPVKLTKTLDDRLATGTVDFSFTVKLTEADGTAITGFTLAEGIEPTDSNGEAGFTMSPTDAADVTKNFKAPVGATMTITESVDTNYEITVSAKDYKEKTNVFVFTVTADGADIIFNNVRKMAEIELSKTLVGKVSKTESFTFTLTLKNGNDPVANYVVYRDETDPDNKITTDGNGIATVPFEFGENETDPKSIPLTIPEGIKLVVAETEIKKDVGGTQKAIYDTTYSVNGGVSTKGLTVTINNVSGNDHSIAFTNTRKTNTITVTNTVKGYSGNVVPFTFTATVTDGGENQDDYDDNGFTNGVMSFELTTGQNKVLTVPYGATLTITETFIVGYETTIKRGNTDLGTTRTAEFQVSNTLTVAFTNNQLIGLRIVNNTSSTLQNVQVYVGYGTRMYLVNDKGDDQELVPQTSGRWATLESIEAGKTAQLEIMHKTGVTDEQDYTVKGTAPAVGYYYTIHNEPSFHETANPAILRVYDAANYEVKGKLRYSVADSTVTFTEQPLVSFDPNGGEWTTAMEDYHWDNVHKVYQKAVNTGETVARPDPDPIYPTAEGIGFLGWTKDEEYAKQDHSSDTEIDPEKAYKFATEVVTAPFMLYAVWAKPARDERVVTVKNGHTESLNVTATLTQNGEAIVDHTVVDGQATDADGKVSFTLSAGESKNLTVPDGAKLVLSLENASLAVSSEYTLTASTDNKSFTIDKVERDGTVTFIPGICKITDDEGKVLYDNTGNPAVYGTLAAAFTVYDGTLYTDATHTTEATQAAVKMLVDEYEIGSKHTFPNKKMTLTTAGKDDDDFPFLGIQDRATLYRDDFTAESLFAHTNASEITLTDIILDGRNVPVGAVNGGLINVNKSGAKLTIDTGTTLQNVVFAGYGSNAYGGAIYIKNGTLAVNGGLFSNLHASKGGAIFTGGDNTNAQMSIVGTDIRFENCCTETTGDGDGGAIYYYNKNADKPMEIDGGSDKANPGISFDSCVAKGSTGDGGAIYAYTNQVNSVTVSGCSFTECSARDETKSNAAYGGGAICADGVSGVTVSYCSFTDCDTQSRGGAVVVYVKNGGEVSAVDSTFERCNCKGQGGGMAVYQPNQEASQVPKVTDARAQTKLSVNACEFSNCSSGTDNGSGGAIQCYLPRMEFTGSTFTDCWAGKEGGAVNNYFGNGYTVVWPGTYMHMTNCTFTRCRAEDRYQAEQPQHYGGGVNTKVQTVTITGSYFTDCVSTLREGGALHLGGQGTGSTATITGSTFKNCMAKTGGGAVMASTETLEVNGSYFYGCQAFGVPAANYVYNNNNKKNQNGGGAISHSENSRGTSTQKTTTITNCVFTADPDGGEDALSCSTVTNGGAIWTRANSDVTIKDCTITGCDAGNNGGGVYLDTGVTNATLTGGSISGCQAVSGSAVYVGKMATFSSPLKEDKFDPDKSLTISGNSVSGANSGAIQTVDAGKLYFEGNVVVENNTSSAEANDHDVLMQIDDNTIINTTYKGLGVGAKIGVYVSDPNNAYANHGKYSQPFGTYHNSDAGSDFLDAFFNDRDSELYGYQGEDAFIYWGFYVCKITDAEGNTLKRTNGRDAIYQRLSQALDDFTSVTGGDPVYIKMLVQDYPIRQDTAISNFPAANITLTTASSSDASHPYRGTEGTVCTIYRTNSETPLFSVGTANAVFQLKDITLDGRKDKTAAEGDYKLITASTGTIIVNSGTTLQYAKGDSGAGDSGAAISGVTVTINGSYDAEKKEPTVKITNCTATGNGGAISAQNLTITNDRETQGEYGTVFTSCSSGADGGAIYATGVKITMTGASFTDCQSTGEGGVLFHNYTETESAETAITNCAFTNSEATGGAGGAISSNAATLTVGSSMFDACKAASNGGAISHTGSTRTELNDCTFDACRTETTDSSSGFGGSVYTGAKVVTLNGGSFENSTAANHGGALYCASSDEGSTASISGTSFDNCATTRPYNSTDGTVGTGGTGGAIYSRTMTLTLQKYPPEGGTAANTTNTTINACTAPGFSGAVHMETSGSTLNIKDGSKISACFADKGGAIYLPAGVTMNLTDSPEFSENGYRINSNGAIDQASEGACIYLAEGGRINFKDSPKFSRNIMPNTWVTNGGVNDYQRQDIYMAGYESSTEYDTNAASIYVVGELTGDTREDARYTIWVWPEKAPHRNPNDQFAKIENGVTVSEDTLSHFRNALADSDTTCGYGEYLAGVQLSTDTKNVYWDKMYFVSFRKIDNKSVAVPDAEFTLYKDATCTEPVATAVSADGIYDTDAQGNLLEIGTVEFDTIRIGVYYMRETEVPLSFQGNDTTYLVLVGSPNLSKNESNKYLWEGEGPLNVDDAETLVARHTTDAGKYYGIFPLKADAEGILRADLSASVASSNVGVQNIRKDYQAAFMKQDSNGKPLPGAVFTVYAQIVDEEGNPKTFVDGYPQLKLWSRDGETTHVSSADGTDAYRDIHNNPLPKGVVYFRELPLGTYFLLETEYPVKNGDNRRAFFKESDRVLKLVLEEKSGSNEDIEVTLSVWNPTPEDKTHYEPLQTVTVDGKVYYVVSNQEVVCKLTDANENLLYVEGNGVWEHGIPGEEPTYMLYPAIYTTLQEGFAAAQNKDFVDGDGNPVIVNAVKLKMLKDVTLTDPYDPIFVNGSRAITLTTAETRASTEEDPYVFSTNRTSETSRALISRGYNDPNGGALITVINGAELTLQNIILNGQKDKYTGRAIHVGTDQTESTGTLNILEKTLIQNFSAPDLRGGAILLENGSNLEVNGGSYRSAVFSGNESAYGGAIAVASDRREVNIVYAQFNGNNAGNNGGAVYVPAGGSASFNSVAMSGNSADMGAAVYVSDGGEARFTGGTATVPGTSITGNTARDANGGAINVGVEGTTATAKLYFSGNTTVFDNTGASDPAQQKNVVLDFDSNAIINTDGAGLSGGTIGVYVIDGDDSKTLFEEHGLQGKPFGSYSGSSNNLNVFRNDRNLVLYGVTGAESGRIYWRDVICKLTQPNDNLLFRDVTLNINGKIANYKAPAVYLEIQDGFDEAQGKLFVNTAGTEYSASDLKLKMLKDAELTAGIEYTGNRSVTFTTAEKDLSDTMKGAGDYFNFHTSRETDDDKSLIKRAFEIDNKKNTSMISITEKGNHLTLTNIMLDGAKLGSVNPGDRSYKGENGGIVYVSNNGKLTITTGAVLQNSAVSQNGGAVYVAKGGTVTMNGGTVYKNESVGNGAGIYLAEGSTLNLSGNPNFGGDDQRQEDDEHKGELKGTDGNFALKVWEGSGEPENGGKVYPKQADETYLVRQDIYIAGYAGDKDEDKSAASLVINGPITSGDGTIWVWAEESPHYKALCQFARIKDGVTVTEDTCNVFRNAQDDIKTGNETGEYLRGTLEGETTGYVYWNGVSGSRKVILRKVDKTYTSYTAASGVSFTVYKGSATSPYQPKGEQPLTGLTPGDSGCFWIGNLPFGWYIIEENESAYFYVVVTAKGTYNGPEDPGGTTRPDAETAAKELYENNK